MRVPSLGISALCLSACLPLSPSVAQTCNTADRSVLLILDASGSMNARLPNGESRIDVARRAVKGVATQLPAKAQVSLRIYGAQSPPREKNCQDTRVAVPFANADANGAAITAFIDGSKAQGYTPIALSLQQAASDFPAGARERVVVLVSDGKETCQGDPVVAAKALAAAGITVHTVGFIVDTAARGQLQSIARIAGGTYFDAPVGPELPETLRQALSACKKVVAAIPARPQPGKLRTTSATWLASHAVFNAETGQQVGKLDSASREIALPAGIYEVRFGAGSWKGIEVRAGETTTIQPGEIKLDPTAGAVVVDSETGEKHGSMDRMSSAVTLMPGLYDVTMGKTEWRFIRVDGGKTVTLRPVQIKLASDLKWERARVVGSDGEQVFRFDRMTSTAILAPGNYVVEVDGKRTTFNGGEGEVLEIKPQ
jgi:hypothetical protein